MPVKLLIFDLDDTLYPEMQFVISGFREVSRVIGQEFHIDSNRVFALLLREFRNDRRFVFDRVLVKLNIYAEDLVQRLVALYRNHKPRISLYRDALEIIPILKSRLYLGMITDGYPPTQKQKIKVLGIEKYFDRIIYTWEKGQEYAKPSPQPFIDILEGFLLRPEEAIYVGDNLEKDFKGPRRIGMRSVMVLRDGIYKNVIATEQDYYPDFQIPSLQNLVELIEHLA